MNIKDYFNIFTYHGSGMYAFGRVFDTFKELHWFDLKRNVNTTEIKADGYEDSRYMIYMPVYTSVCFEMIRKSFEWYTSGIRYSNPNLIPIFVDLGAGSGKTLLIANETKFFQICVGVELNEVLSKRSQKNLPPPPIEKSQKQISNASVLHIHANVESVYWADQILINIPKDRHRDIVLFAFNHNSYDCDVVTKTLDIINQKFVNSLYLYQNPTQQRAVLNAGFEEIQRDAAPNNAHKNFKYIIYRNTKKNNLD
ncbi:MAG: hypothetical protein CMF71_06820 [Magnetovibrio sp.]|nr:hypothetical protein [Magnetovibrio sp.]